MKMESGNNFNLTRRFLVLSLISIGLASILSSALLSRFLTQRMMQREADVMMEFVQSVVQIELAKGYSLDQPAASTEMLEFFTHVATMPDVVRANVYAKDKTLLWSSDHKLGEGKKLGNNPELDEALEGHLEIESGVIGKEDRPKDEHLSLGQSEMKFVEIYMPVRDPKSRSVVGVVEVYRIPNALFEAINAGIRLIWMIALVSGLLLYVTLFWIVRRADQLIRCQQEQLVESQTMGAVGEMASAVAHGIRNPLASIRSSAELWHDSVGDAGVESAGDIIAEVDRVEKWIRELLTYSQPQDYLAEAVDLNAVVAYSMDGFSREAERRGVRIQSLLSADLPRVQANAALLNQVFNNLIANALEAMSNEGGRITLDARVTSKHVVVSISDTGHGIAPAHLEKICTAFFTTKPKGLGVGLTLVRRIVKRFGGSMHLESTYGKGATITLNFLSAS
jgi:two-component system, NtrC family, sensor histidine kinase HydH